MRKQANRTQQNLAEGNVGMAHDRTAQSHRGWRHRIARFAGRFLWSVVHGVAIVSAGFGSGVALAADIYVDLATGSDANPGTLASPVKSIGKGLDLAASGDTVHVAPGDYDTSVESFPLAMKPGVAVIADQGSLETSISTDGGDTLVEFSGGDFDASAMLQGFRLRGTTGYAALHARGAYVLGDGSGGGTVLAPVIRDNVFQDLGYGVYAYGTKSDTDVEVSPIVSNNVFDGIKYYAFDTWVYGGDSANPVIAQNLINGTDEINAYSYGIRLNADGNDGNDGNDGGGGRISATIEDNVIARTAYGIFLQAYAGDEENELKLDRSRGQDSISGPVASDVVADQSMTIEPTDGGAVDAHILNNRLGASDLPNGYGVYGVGRSGGDVGGQVQFHAAHNEIMAFTGVTLFADQASSGSSGSSVMATIDDNHIRSIFYDNPGSSGVHLWAYAAGETIAYVTGNQVESEIGVALEARATIDGAPGGFAGALIEGNEIDGSNFRADTVGVVVTADGGRGSSGGDLGGGAIAYILDNQIAATYGMDFLARGAKCCAPLGSGGGILAAVDRNDVEALNLYQSGVALRAAAEDSENPGVATTTGGSILLEARNNMLRGYYGVDAEVETSVAFEAQAGAANLSLVNNTILGGGVGSGYDEGVAVWTRGGSAIAPFHPTIDNNILMTTEVTDEAPLIMGSDSNPFNDPASLDNNDLFARQAGVPVAELRGATFFSTGVVNTFDFADDNISVEPGFACENGGSRRLGAGSPLIDAGKPDSVEEDFEGDSRPLFGGIDIGADEYNGSEVGNTFQDVAPDNPYHRYIEALAREGITGGCSVNPPLYCPTQVVSREQMAVFIVRGLGAAPDSTGAPLFADVPASRFSFPFVQTLGALGITGGCAPSLYCPLDPVARSQMAVFLVRALGESPDDSLPALFADVPPGHPYYGWIQKLAKLGITSGCAAGSYCPDAPVTREQMAVFLARAFDLPLPLPCTKVAGGKGVQPGVGPEGQAPSELPLARVAQNSPRLLSSPRVAERSGLSQRLARLQRPERAVMAPAKLGARGPAPNRYLRLTAEEHRMLAEPPSTPVREMPSAGPARGAERLKPEQLRSLVDAGVSAFLESWRNSGRTTDELNRGMVRRVVQAAVRGHKPAVEGSRLVRPDARRAISREQRRDVVSAWVVAANRAVAAASTRMDAERARTAGSR